MIEIITVDIKLKKGLERYGPPDISKVLTANND